MAHISTNCYSIARPPAQRIIGNSEDGLGGGSFFSEISDQFDNQHHLDHTLKINF